MPKRVLLADDSNTIQRVVELAFASEDISIVTAADGERAIELLRQSPADLVMADIDMPHRTGYDVAEWLRNQPDLSGVPVVLLAGAFETVDTDRARAAGVDGVLTKPLDPAAMVGKVTDLLASGRLHPAQPTDSERERPHAPAAASAPASGAPASVEPRAAATAEADLYFEEIDRAFAQLTKSPKPPPAPEPDADVEEELTTYLAPPPGAPPRVPAPSGAPLGDAFATLLEAERTGAVVLPLGRIDLPPSAPAPAAMDVDALADQVVQRVLAQLSDRVVRETVARLVSTTAERLVREEIDRIKRNIK